MKKSDAASIADALRYQMASFIDKPASQGTKDDMKRSIGEMLGRMEAEIHDHEVVKVRTLWEDMNWLEKARWFFSNKIFGFIGNQAREKVNYINSVRWLEAQEEIIDDEDESVYSHYDRLDYPRWAQPEPKTLVLIDTKIKLSKPIEFISLSVQLDQLLGRK